MTNRRVRLPAAEGMFCPECGNDRMLPQRVKAESGKTRYRCSKCGFRTTAPLNKPPAPALPKPKVTKIKKHKRYIITSAVNDTPIVEDAFLGLLQMAKELDACVLVIPGVYKNPDLKHQGIAHTYSWPAEVLPYTVDADVELCPTLVVRGKMRIQYTALRPLSGMNHAGDCRSEIFGHPQVAMQLVASAKLDAPKMLRTTGSISVKHYSSSKQGQQAEFHHKIGAVFVETSGKRFWSTELSYDGTGFSLYDRYFTARGERKAPAAEAIVYGDTHVRFLTDKTRELLEHAASRLRPKLEVFHDLHDHHIGSHHSDKDVLFKMAKSKTRELFIRDELMMSVEFLRAKKNPVVVTSNHDEHLTQWFNRFKPQGGDVANLDLYYELAALARSRDDKNLFKLFVEQHLSHVTFTDRNKTFDVAGIDCSQHGDKGPNGARGSALGFARTGHKTVIGHSHTPQIEKGCYQVGTSATDMEYAQGYSSWANAHCIIYSNGKRGMLFLIDDLLPPILR